ncbi:MAG: hypothetical protein QG608_1671 [Actinomycetota bacterium]|nr:hypothetical protein [Actinomycetota bacterium]
MAATMALGISFLVLAGSWIIYEERHLREFARSPVTASSKNRALLRYTSLGDELTDQQTHSVYLVEPVTADAPVPPGLSRWPAPGEVFLSPQLLRDGADEEITSRYGRFVGTIGPEGLGVPDERLAMVRPSGDWLKKNSELYSGFAGRDRAEEGRGESWGGESSRLYGLREFTSCVLGMLVLPALVLLFVVNGFGIEERRRRDLLLSTLGAGRGARRWVALGDVLAPVLTGVALTALALVTVVRMDPRLPVTDFIVPGDQLALHPLLLAVALCGAGFLAVVVSLLGTGRRKAVGRTPRQTRTASPWIRASAFPAALFLTVRLPDVLDPSRGPVWSVTYLLGVAATFFTLPFALGLLTAALGQMVVLVGRATGAAGVLISGRRLRCRPMDTARTMAGAVVLVGVLLQASLWSSLFNQFITQDLAQRDTLGNSVVLLYPTSRHDLSGFIDSLPAGTGTVLVDHLFQDAGPTLTAQCTDLRSLGLPCGGKVPVSEQSQRTRTVLRHLQVDDSSILNTRVGVIGPLSSGDESRALVISAPAGGSLDLSDLKRLAFQTLSGLPPLGYLGDEALRGDADSAHQAVWIVLFGVGTAIVLGLALGVTATTRFREQSQSLGPVSMLTSRSRLPWAIGWWTIALPMAVAAWAALVVSWLLADPITSMRPGTGISGTLQIALPVILTGIAVLTWVYASVNTVRSLRTWRPRNV